jgi:hypothetical protein
MVIEHFDVTRVYSCQSRKATKLTAAAATMMRALSVTALYVLLLFQISSATQELDSESFEALMDSGKALV